MSVVLEHPSSFMTKEVFEFDIGKITIESAGNMPLMSYEAIALLERVKFYILSVTNPEV